MKKWTWICLIILAVFSIAFFVVHSSPGNVSGRGDRLNFYELFTAAYFS